MARVVITPAWEATKKVVSELPGFLWDAAKGYVTEKAIETGTKIGKDAYGEINDYMFPK